MRGLLIAAIVLAMATACSGQVVIVHDGQYPVVIHDQRYNGVWGVVPTPRRLVRDVPRRGVVWQPVPEVVLLRPTSVRASCPFNALAPGRSIVGRQ